MVKFILTSVLRPSSKQLTISIVRTSHDGTIRETGFVVSELMITVVIQCENLFVIDVKSDAHEKQSGCPLPATVYSWSEKTS